MIEIKQHSGTIGGRTVKHTLDTITHVDVDGRRTLLGFADHRPGAPFQAICNAIPEAIVADVRQALSDRDERYIEHLAEDQQAIARAGWAERPHEIPPSVQADEAAEICDDDDD